MKRYFLTVTMAVLACAMASCAPSNAGKDGPPSRFIGAWSVGGFAHPVPVEFAADRSLSVDVTDCIATGAGCSNWVQINEPAVTCVFGQAWNDAGASTLLLETTCSDGAVRDLELEFLGPASENSLGTEVELIRLGEFSADSVSPGFIRWSFTRE
jgi:hypothetical protein